MYLKSITLKGFKSFPDRTRLDFDPGVSVIVGPNGSGKSNITDAVLWALGEQSPMAVRGQSMQDVIFGGAPGRQSARNAEVELVLDDSDGTLGLGVPEVSVVRRLDRSGEGEYRLAGARCRLIDVIEVLSDTGLGKEMHSVISQGRVEAIVTSKPRDRRLLIEEAAGLGKHRKRRRRAQLKLARTQDNLDRALDVEREARSRLRPLKRQAEAAELHARLQRQSLEARVELARGELAAQLAVQRQAEADVATARSQREQVEHELHAVAAQRESAEEALAARSATREQLSRRCFVAQSVYDGLSYRLETATGTATVLEHRRNHAHDLLTELRRQAAADKPDLGVQSTIDALEGELAALDRDRDVELSRQIAGLRHELSAAAAKTADHVATEGERLQARERAELAVEEALQGVRDAERDSLAARREAARVGGELAAVNQFLRSDRSTPGGVAALADELQVDAGYELAVAAALDGRLSAVVVADVAGATALLDGTGAEGGRALIAPADSPAERESASSSPAPTAERLLDHVAGADPALAVARSLLLDVWVVETIEQVADTFAGVAVTRDGRVFSPAWREVRQAPAVGEDRRLAQRNLRERLVRESEEAVQREQQAGASLDRAAAELARAEEARELAIAAHRAAVRERDEAAEEERRLAAVIDRREAAPDDGPGAARRAQVLAELQAHRAELQRAEIERAERSDRIERLEAVIKRDEALRPALGAVIEAIESAAAAITAARSRFEAELTADREAGEHLTVELRECAQQEAALHARLHTDNESVTSCEVRAQRGRDLLAELDHELRDLAARLGLEPTPTPQPLNDQEREALTAQVERLARRREQLGPVNPLAEQEYADAVAHVEELERQRADLETALRELEKLIADTDRQIRETFEQTFAAAASNFEELAAQLFPGGKGRLRIVKERAGPARMLGGQPAESESAEEDSDEEPSEQPEEDLLGVEIEITPPGKDMKRLSLLSGGEKSLTALAFLFAVFLARPCPFYILDEVEAALDDLNIDRFLGLLRRYCKRAQFIVVTHQKRTMEAADALYGVSMGGDGLSKVVSRRLPAQEVAA